MSASRVWRMVDRLQALAARHDRALSIVSTLWLVLVSFSWAGIIPLPDLALLHGTPAVIASSAWNAAWWGFIHPALTRRRSAQDTAQDGIETV